MSVACACDFVLTSACEAALHVLWRIYGTCSVFRPSGKPVAIPCLSLRLRAPLWHISVASVGRSIL